MAFRGVFDSLGSWLYHWRMPALARILRQQEWYLEPPPVPDIVNADLEEARGKLKDAQDWVAAAVLGIRYVVAALRARGSARNLDRLIERYAAASRQAFESRSTMTRGAATLREIIRDLRSQGERVIDPDLAQRLFSKAQESEARISLAEQHADIHRKLIEAYSDALLQLANVRNETDNVALIAQLIGPCLGGALLAGIVFSSPFAALVGAAIGASVGILRRREVVDHGH